MTTNPFERFEIAFSEPEKVNAEEYQKIIAENAAKASENIERLTLRLLSLVALLILVALGEITILSFNLAEISNKFIILLTLLILISYTHYDLIFTLSKFDHLSVIYKIIIKHRHSPIHEHRLSKYFLFAPALYEYVYSPSKRVAPQLQHQLWLAEFLCITLLIPFGAEFIGLLSLSILAGQKYSFLFLVGFVVMIVFNLQSGLTLISLLREANIQRQ